MHEVLSLREMAEADRLAILEGPSDGFGLMRRAGGAIAALVLRRYPDRPGVVVLCGPGNNGGDGYIVAERLAEAGMAVAIYAEGAPKPGTDAARAAAACRITPGVLADFRPQPETLVVDALYGAGLSRPVSDDVAQAIKRASAAACVVLAVDLPSGVSGHSGGILGSAFRAALTVTFARRKPGHLLFPGRESCGETVVAEIGISSQVVAAVGASCFENGPGLWQGVWPSPAVDAHKYTRGHVAVISGGAFATGAARLAAMAAARAGAGAVTLLSPASAMAVNAGHLTSIMLREADTAEAVLDFITSRRVAALVYGPGLEPSHQTARTLAVLLESADGRPPIVVDAGALTALATEAEAVFSASRRLATPIMALTPHEGEFGRVFPGLAADMALSKLDRARLAARRANAVVVYKGADTVIAAPGGRAAINLNATPLLATAGSGDVLAGIIAGLAAQKMPLFEACCAAVWLHAEAAERFGPGLIAEDIPLALPAVLRDLGASIRPTSGTR